ncbi:MAG: adenylate/guanylate cyclase domain-containing protein [Dehalococcoidia bacterium]
MSIEPQIQYARTSDGVSIAYSTSGDGPPILYCHDHSIAMQHHWTGSAPLNDTIRTLSARTQVTIFDAAGIGASQRDVSDFSLEAQVRAIEAVAAHLAGAQFTLIGTATATASAAFYAAQQPGRVRELICMFPAFPIVRRTGAAIRDNWSLDRRRWAGTVFPDGPVSGQRWYSNAMRESMTAEVFAAYRAAFADADLSAIYQRIPVPTLLCIAKDGPARDASLALASLVPNCRVASTPDAGNEWFAAILEFMGVEAAPDSPPPAPAAGGGAAVILFTDIVSSTELTERMGDARFRNASRALDASLRAAIRDAGGVTVEAKTLGDGVLATFGSAAQAIEGARRCLALSAASELGLHIGLHAGDVIREENNVFGGAVNIAARICALSAPGEILVSDVVRGMARSSAGVVFEDRGEQEMKGVGEPVRVYAVRRRDA